MAEPVHVSEDPSSLTRWVVAHPVLWALVSGIAAYAMGLGLFDGEYPVAWLAASAGLGMLNYVLWRRGGPGHALRAYVLRRLPAKERRSTHRRSVRPLRIEHSVARGRARPRIVNIDE